MRLLENYLTREQLAAELEVSPRTIARWHDHPDGLPCTTMGQRILYRKSAVLAWIDSRERRPNPRRNPGAA